MSFESRPRSSAGTIAALRSDLYAGRLSRAFGGERLLASLYGGYTHDDATPGGGGTATTASATYGGGGGPKRPGGWGPLSGPPAGRAPTIPRLGSGGPPPGRGGGGPGAVAGRAAPGRGVPR